MIVGGYALDLYCDGKPCRKTKAVQSEFNAQTYAQCAKAARGAGWKLNRSAGLAFCTKDCRP